MLDRRMGSNELFFSLERIIHEIRGDHPTMHCRAMYHKIKPQGIGRDKFEYFCKMNGLNVGRKRSAYRTTDSTGVIRFENHLKDATLTHINQAFSSDITYYELGGRFYYITFILDCYSRYILGYSVSKSLRTVETTLPALKMALKTRNGELPKGVIFHSDGGGQYYEGSFLALTKKNGMINSMCEYAYENGKAERINGVIKNNYLEHYKMKSFQELEKGVDRAVRMYNREKPHKGLQNKTPWDFEKETVVLNQQTKPKVRESLTANYSF